MFLISLDGIVDCGESAGVVLEFDEHSCFVVVVEHFLRAQFDRFVVAFNRTLEVLCLVEVITLVLHLLVFGDGGCLLLRLWGFLLRRDRLMLERCVGGLRVDILFFDLVVSGLFAALVFSGKAF